ncbi:MAG: hypothetical protein ACI9XJ_002511 [Marivirga sp.]
MTDNQKKTTLKWRSRYKRAQLAHSYTAISYGRYHLFLGALLIVLTTASCVLIFAENLQPVWLSPVIGISAALFAYLQTFLQLSEKADAQRGVARQYGALKKKLEYIIDFEHSSDNLSKMVNAIRIKENEIATGAPHALSHCWEKAKVETQAENDSLSIRNRK